MTTLAAEVWIDAPKEKVWDIVADFGNISLWNPNVPNSYLTSDQTTGEGTTRHCDLSLSGVTVEERILEWNDGESMTIEIYDGTKTPPWKSAQATFTLKEKDGGTHVVGAFSFEMKYGPIGKLMSKFMIEPQFGKAWQQLFAGLKHHVETGEQVDSPKGLDFSAVQAVPA
ncbi:SRPBCC family protein [Chloroflexi bacterium TSY]|nr:SRPBCC family protein [Chloroflexi bacterium TSY]